MQERLDDFVKESLAQGLGRDEITAAARRADWTEADVNKALAAWDDASFGVPVPRKPAKTGSEFFFYLFRFTVFYACLWGLIDLVFAAINRWVPSPDQWPGSYAYETRYAVATLTVALPLYVFLLLRNRKFLALDPSRYASGARRGFIGLTLFASGATAMIGAIALVAGMLAFQGNLNGGLKLGALIALSAIIFADYKTALDPPSASGSKMRNGLLWVALVAVLGLYANGLSYALSHRETPRVRPEVPPVTAPAVP